MLPPEPDDPIFIFTHLRGSPFIIGKVVSVLSAVYLYYEAALMTAEIGDEAFDGVGALEAMAKISTGQMVPCTPILAFPHGTEWGKGKNSPATAPQNAPPLSSTCEGIVFHIQIMSREVPSRNHQ